MGSLRGCRAIAFDLFGTVLDLGGSLRPALEAFLRGRGGVDAAAFWQQLRYRQRIEQYQDSLMLLGHGGYLETVRRAFSYVARAHGLTPRGRDRRLPGRLAGTPPLPRVPRQPGAVAGALRAGGPLQR